MSEITTLETEGLDRQYYRLYREFFDRAESKRRWNIAKDIPWDQVNPRLDPAIADIIESFCAVEMYLPDYISKAIPRFRGKRGQVWFHANWGYEESKHSLAMGDWLLKSGMRTEEQFHDLEERVFAHEWQLHHTSPIGMVMYGMVQELATWLNYRNLRHRVADLGGDPALSTILRFVMVDEACHHDFYRSIIDIYLERDREETLKELRAVVNGFRMPSIYLMADSKAREKQIRELRIFSEDIFYQDVVRPILDKMGVSWAEFRDREKRKSLATTGRNGATTG